MVLVSLFGRPIVWSISHFFLVGQKKIVLYQKGAIYFGFSEEYPRISEVWFIFKQFR